MRKISFLSSSIGILVAFTSFCFLVFASPAETDDDDERVVSARLDRALQQIDELTQEQSKMLADQKEIVEEIRNLKIRSNKR